MTLEEIKEAVLSGKTVCWSNDGYTIIQSKEDFLIKHHSGHCIGLVWADGVTMNGEESEFYIK